ncbi:hypothetical protein ACIQ9Q_24810 [Streptomyces sp. NPDC094438]|uniref:hypothetical protein n=1 Tax=Streptomyces sp. NPDC094438 TaxID=3366061 RepID=UPI00382B83B0
MHLVGDGQIPELNRTDPVEAARAFQGQGARWLHVVVAEEEDGCLDLGQAQHVIEASTSS